MDLMHKGTLDGFCLISSDSDFTRLAQRLREDGLTVYGFGERKTPEAFRNACNRFIYVENLIEADAEKTGGSGTTATASRKQPPSKAVKIVIKAMEGEDEDGWVNLGSVGSRILGAAPDFDPRTYGSPNLSTLVTRSGGFEIRKEPGEPVFIPPQAVAEKDHRQGPVAERRVSPRSRRARRASPRGSGTSCAARRPAPPLPRDGR